MVYPAAVSRRIWSLLKKIRSPLNEDHQYSVEEGMWLFFNAFPPFCLLMAFDDYVASPYHIHFGIIVVVAFVCTGIQGVVFFTLSYWNTYTPYQLVGAKGRFMIECIPAVFAAAWHQYLVFRLGDLSLLRILEDESGPLCLLLACMSYFYLVAHFLHRAYDITPKDVIVGLAKQVVCFMVCGELFIRLLTLFFCVSSCFYRYMTYAAPGVIPHPKRESEDLPC